VEFRNQVMNVYRMGKDLSNFAVVGARLNSEGIIRARFQPVSLSLT
jgi:hypothetical protein